MDLLGSLMIACSMYSRIPVPHVEWTPRRMKFALCFFPVVGVIIGGVMTGYVYAAGRFGLGTLAYGVFGLVIPILISGGIHMDGFLDVIDAKSSRQTPERKLEIMKDPHGGAFAILCSGVYLLLYLGAFSELHSSGFPTTGGIYVLTRAISGWSVVTFKQARKDGLANTFSSQAETRVVQCTLMVWALLAVGYMTVLGGLWFGLGVLGISVVITIRYAWECKMEFGGVTGDLAGYFLQLLEICLVWFAAIYF